MNKKIILLVVISALFVSGGFAKALGATKKYQQIEIFKDPNKKYETIIIRQDPLPKPKPKPAYIPGSNRQPHTNKRWNKYDNSTITPSDVEKMDRILFSMPP
jgi:hypothetical protein